MDNKPLYEKIGIWVSIIAGIFGILGISIFGSKSLIRDKKEQVSTIEDSKNTDEIASSSNSNNVNDSLESTEDSNNQEHEDIKTNKDEDVDNVNTNNNEPDIKQKESDNKTITPFVTSTPQSDMVTKVDLTNWSDEDRDIFNNTYTGFNTFKLSVYNMIFAMGGGADDIIAEVHFPLGERFNSIWVIDFVVMQDMLGNGSSAKVTILSDEEELYPTFMIESDTTSENKYEVNLSGIRDLVVRFECHAVDSGFCSGIIINDKEEQ